MTVSWSGIELQSLWIAYAFLKGNLGLVSETAARQVKAFGCKV